MSLSLKSQNFELSKACQGQEKNEHSHPITGGEISMNSYLQQESPILIMHTLSSSDSASRT